MIHIIISARAYLLRIYINQQVVISFVLSPFRHCNQVHYHRVNTYCTIKPIIGRVRLRDFQGGCEYSWRTPSPPVQNSPITLYCLKRMWIFVGLAVQISWPWLRVYSYKACLWNSLTWILSKSNRSLKKNCFWNIYALGLSTLFCPFQRII